MNDNLTQQLESSLKAYSVYVESWDVQCGDTFLLFGERDFLQRHLNSLSEKQVQEMHKTDRQVLELLDVDYVIPDNESDDDINTLRFVGDIIQGREIPQPNPDLIIRL